MRIVYEGKEIEVSHDVGEFMVSYEKYEKKNARANTRTDRHIPIDKFPGEPVEFFSDKNCNTEMSVLSDMEVERLLSCLNERQRELVQKCVLEGWKYTELARLEGKDESAIRKAVNRALEKIKKILE